jgi:hypothetical protein
MVSPAGFEQYFRDVASAASDDGPPDPQVMAELMSRYDIEVVR